ncbi:MAG: cytochrome c family protein [Desulfovibrio sp.]|nr:cytochrome c family protein [Desulfovibrio sp.]
MRNGTTLLLLAAIAVAGVAYLTLWEPSLAPAAPALTSVSDAPSAMVIFPVGEKPNYEGVGMKPVVFNHLVHKNRVENCESCHHTGETVACTTCHTVEGNVKGKFVTLNQAMHTLRILPQADRNTPQSCVSCHTKQLQKPKCAGCHSIVKPTRSEIYCNVCHSVTGLTKADIVDGIAGKLSDERKAELAANTLKARKNPVQLQPTDGPYKVMIDDIADKYKANMFAHRRHVNSLMGRIKDNALASAFHNQPTTLCSTCHHNRLLASASPKCGSCHSQRANPDPATPARPQLKAAYHLQCMGCHKGMNVARPLNISCVTCHKESEGQSVARAAEKLGEK